MDNTQLIALALSFIVVISIVIWTLSTRKQRAFKARLNRARLSLGSSNKSVPFMSFVKVDQTLAQDDYVAARRYINARKLS